MRAWTVFAGRSSSFSVMSETTLSVISAAASSRMSQAQRVRSASKRKIPRWWREVRSSWTKNGFPPLFWCTRLPTGSASSWLHTRVSATSSVTVGADSGPSLRSSTEVPASATCSRVARRGWPAPTSLSR